MRLLLPLLVILAGLGAGVGGGLLLRPDHAETAMNPCGDVTAEAAHETAPADVTPENVQFVKLSNQFIVPVVADERIAALVVLSLSLAVDEDSQERVFQQEPKIRDTFLQVLFDHANNGGFDGAFTSSGKMVFLRRALLEAAQKVLGPTVSEVLIVEVVRQDA